MRRGPRAEYRNCEDCGKRCLTRDEAHLAARNLNSHQQNDRAPVHAYKCGTSWHAGHVPKAKARNRKNGRTRSGIGPKPLTPYDQLPPELQ